MRDWTFSIKLLYCKARKPDTFAAFRGMSQWHGYPVGYVSELPCDRDFVEVAKGNCLNQEVQSMCFGCDQLLRGENHCQIESLEIVIPEVFIDFMPEILGQEQKHEE